MQKEKEKLAYVRKKQKESFLTPFPRVPAVDKWLSSIADGVAKFATRFPMLVLLGPSFSGKTEFAMSLFSNPLMLRIGANMFFPDGMRAFDQHDAIVLDDIRDAQFIVKHQDVLQSTNGEHWFGQSPTGQSAYWKNLWGTPFILTMNFTTTNLQYFLDDDFCKRAANCRLARFPFKEVQEVCKLEPFPDVQEGCNLDERFNL